MDLPIVSTPTPPIVIKQPSIPMDNEIVGVEKTPITPTDRLAFAMELFDKFWVALGLVTMVMSVIFLYLVIVDFKAKFSNYLANGVLPRDLARIEKRGSGRRKATTEKSVIPPSPNKFWSKIVGAAGFARAVWDISKDSVKEVSGLKAFEESQLKNSDPLRREKEFRRKSMALAKENKITSFDREKDAVRKDISDDTKALGKNISEDFSQVSTNQNLRRTLKKISWQTNERLRKILRNRHSRSDIVTVHPGEFNGAFWDAFAEFDPQVQTSPSFMDTFALVEQKPMIRKS